MRPVPADNNKLPAFPSSHHLRELRDCHNHSFREPGDNRRSESFFICLRTRIGYRLTFHIAPESPYLVGASQIACLSVKQLHQRVLLPFFVLSRASTQRTMPISLFHSTKPRKCQPNSSLNVAVHGKRDIATETKTALA